MQVGDLVWCKGMEELGIIVSQIGCIDRWMVYWFEGDYRAGSNGCNIELL